MKRRQEAIMYKLKHMQDIIKAARVPSYVSISSSDGGPLGLCLYGSFPTPARHWPLTPR